MDLSTPTAGNTEAPVCHVTAKGTDRHEINIRGRFLPGWLGVFTAGLAQKRLNILSVSARKIHGAAWAATFLVDSRLATERIAGIDFLALASGHLGTGQGTIVLDNFHIEQMADGAVLVELHAEDQLGFLTRMLKNFLLFSLFPAGLMIETTAGRVHDRFWLRGVGGSAPSAETVEALRAELQKLVAVPACAGSFTLRPAMA